MNKIEEFALKSGFEKTSDGKIISNENDISNLLEEYAKLIIGGCLDACHESLNTKWLIYPTNDRVIIDCQNHIKSYFSE